MRVLVIHPHLHFLGGSEILTRILVYGLEAQGHEVVVLSKDFREDLFKPTSRVHLRRLRRVNEGASLKERLTSILNSLDEVFEEFKDLTPFIMIQEPIYVALIKAVKPCVGVGMYIHFPREEELTKENLRRFLDNFRFPNMYDCLFSVADLHITNSNYTARALYRLYGIESNVVYPAVPEDYFKEAESVEFEGRARKIISVARFVPQKRIDLLIKWFRERIKAEVPGSELVIVGIPDSRYMEYYEKIKSMVGEVEGVELVDRPLKPSELARIYRGCRVYAHLRIGEHFGMAPVEAMSQGTVPVVPRKSGLAELIVNGFNGYSYLSDGEALETIIKVLKMGDEEYARIAKNAWRTSWNFTPTNFTLGVANYLRLITED